MKEKITYQWMGTLFGANLWLETDNEEIVKQARDWQQKIIERSRKLDEIELQAELKK